MAQNDTDTGRKRNLIENKPMQLAPAREALGRAAVVVKPRNQTQCLALALCIMHGNCGIIRAGMVSFEAFRGR